MNSVRVKICGITRVEDAQAALAYGADAIGLVFYDKSPRFVDIGTAQAIARVVGPFVSVVGLFVNASPAEVQVTVSRVGLDLLQFHGDEDELFCRQFDRPYVNAIRMLPGLDIEAEAKHFACARGLLFDSWSESKYGGTGETFDWHRLPDNIEKPLILAGGLTPDNIEKAVLETKPYAVDVSGGVEVAPGIKSAALIDRFIRRAKNAQNHTRSQERSL